MIYFLRPENGGRYCSGPSNRIRSCEDNPVNDIFVYQFYILNYFFFQPCKDPIDMFRQRQCSRYNNGTIDPSLPIGARFEPKYNGEYDRFNGQLRSFFYAEIILG